MLQIDLPFVAQRAADFVPVRAEPAVWISRMVVLRELREEAVVREMRLRRGLNVLWARP
ncbi:MAG: hypothetical protein R3F14_23885 [Polyangiaceae bacterium]